MMQAVRLTSSGTIRRRFIETLQGDGNNETVPPSSGRQGVNLAPMTDRPALLLDLDGTLTDSVYQHALAWRKALEMGGISLSVWRIHRRIGMSGGLLAESLARETGHELTEHEAAKLRQDHARLFAAQLADVRPLPGAKDLMHHLTKMKVPWA